MAKKKQVTKQPAVMGRPTTYKPEYCQKIIEYFSVEPYYEKLKKVVTKQGDVIEIPTLEASDLPTFAGFACEVDACRDTINEWVKEYPDFSAAHKKAKALQERFIAINGNKGLINTAFGIFTAKNVLRWTDRQEIDQTSKVEANIKVDKDKQALDEIKSLISNRANERKK